MACEGDEKDHLDMMIIFMIIFNLKSTLSYLPTIPPLKHYYIQIQQSFDPFLKVDKVHKTTKKKIVKMSYI